MSYYYKASEQFSNEIFEILEKINEYNKVVFDWHDLNFNYDKEEEGIFIFNDIPMFTPSLVRKNPYLKELINSSNDFISQRKAEGKKLIKNWQEYKAERGYKKKESYTKNDYGWLLRRYFFMGAIKTVLDRENNEFYLKTDYKVENNNGEFTEITLREYNEKEIEMSERE